MFRHHDSMGSRAESDDDSLEGVYRSKRKLVRALARKGGEEDAEDVVQDAFLKSMEAEQAQPLKSAAAFVMAVTRNTVIDRLRRRAFRSTIISDSSDLDAVAVDAAPDPERSVIASDRLARTMAIIERLPTRQREVLHLHRFESLTYAQIAKRLGISARTAEGHLAAALNRISAELDQNDADGD
ncbi:RNA polymerase sigma factor [Sphingomonas colocasiae]|uniref:Sigma-70 family RNA polymerase sigma factor n=1 Tax=Sphingomonas colocasiae TaxID=1848973 RepID=A0ABS7PID6_9SPHN|nr:sigma-70 family RNA polymerase sigma factor [Sphingomonas colocasiae]MBY8821062.1 sigma-70 family RNA polymerase sigma factor [Sphingomonas colocasiae]